MDYIEHNLISRSLAILAIIVGCVYAMNKAAKGNLHPSKHKKPYSYFKSKLEKKLDAIDREGEKE